VSDFLAGDPRVADSGRPGRGIVPVVDAGWRSRIPWHLGSVLADGWVAKSTVTKRRGASWTYSGMRVA